MKKFAVFGNPIKQSLSPVIHQAFAKQAEYTISYEKRLSEVECFEEDIDDFFNEHNVVGCNITAPFKERAYSLASVLHDSAKFAEAANTLHIMNGEIEAHNTDGAGLINDLKRHLGSLAGANVLLLGAGGAARGVMQSLIDEGISHLTVANRTESKARNLLKLTTQENVSSSNLQDLNLHYDIVVNSTSASLMGDKLELGNLSFKKTALTYDMSYKASLTPFLKYAQQNGSKKVADGLGMLVGQAAVAFHIWTGFAPSVEALLSSLRQDMPA